jgi:hypothetical protein
MEPAAGDVLPTRSGRERCFDEDRLKSRLRTLGLGFRVSGSGFRVQRLGIRVWGLRTRV